jgi:hypothetical protein
MTSIKHKRPTPETDASISVGLENADRECVPAEFAQKLERERDEAREALRELWQTADAYIPQIDQEQATKWHHAMFANSKNG